MTLGAEDRLIRRGVTFEETDLGRDDPAISGYLVLWPGDGGARVAVQVQPGLAPDRRARFAEWVEQKVDRFFEHGPEPDGWQRRTVDDGWQMWAREVQMPPVD